MTVKYNGTRKIWQFVAKIEFPYLWHGYLDPGVMRRTQYKNCKVYGNGPPGSCELPHFSVGCWTVPYINLSINYQTTTLTYIP